MSPRSPAGARRKAVKPIPSSETSRRPPGSTPGPESPGSFEGLLERLLKALHGSADRQAGIDEAVDLIAAYFSAERVVVSVPGCTSPAVEGSPAGQPDLEEEIFLGPGEGVGRAALFGSGRAESWTDRDARQLRIAAETVCEALYRFKAESDLREQQIWLLMAMESATVGVWDWDVASDRVRYVSPADARVGGIQVLETNGASWSEQTHPEDAKISGLEVERAISGEADTFTMVVRHVPRPGRHEGWRHIYSRGRVVERDEAGRTLRLMGTYEDVTEAHLKAQAEKAREVAMARAARMASLGALASSLAHDLNQPLTALTSYLEGTVRLLSKGKATDSDVVQALERSVSFAHRASDIVRRFRQLLRRDALLEDPVDLASLLLTVRDRMRGESAAAGVEIAVRENLEPVVVRGEGLQVEQVLVNLVRNAIEALEASRRRRRVVTLDVRQAGGLAEVRVSDNGPGVPAGVLDHLFEPLAASKEAGRGLGLVICHSIAELHRGRLEVERTGRDGTTFLLALPSDHGDGP